MYPEHPNATAYRATAQAFRSGDREALARPLGGEFESFTGLDTAQLDNDGNAVFVSVGTGCAAGPSLVTAHVEAGTHATYSTTLNIVPPQPTI